MARNVPALVRGLDILELFLDEDRALSAPDITERLGLPRTTVHELVSSLVARSYLEPVAGQPHRYQPGLRLFQLGSVYANRLDLATVGNQVASALAAACDETCHVAVREGTDVVYIAKADSTHTVRMVSAVGRRLPAHCTAVGKMLLAGLDDAALDALLPSESPLPAMTPNSITSLATLKRELTGAWSRGLAHEEFESNPHVACVAAPVFDHSGSMIAAMSVSIPTIRWAAEKRHEWEQLVAASAATLSSRLGH